jgi:hypothetical protein
MAKQQMRYLFDCSIEKELCQYNLTPTSSSNLKYPKKENPANLHPLGAISKKLIM